MHDKNNCEKQKYRKSFKKALTDYKEGHFEKASKIIDNLLGRKLDNRSKRKIEQVLLLLLLGEFYGINTLNKLLTNYGIESNGCQQLWHNLSPNRIIELMNGWLWTIFSKEFEKRIIQSGSTHSRQKLTIVIDGSIFKQWLVGEKFGKYFAKYYSGQYKSAVYGFNVLLCGMVIGEIFYPLHFQLRRKQEKDSEIATRMLSKVHKKLRTLAANQRVSLPPLYLSVDSGFRSKELLNYCKGCGIIYIGVPKINHVVCKDDERLKIKDLKKEYERKESEYQKTNPSTKEPFTWRVRVHYHCMNEQVTLLLFRLNGSKKVSVIFSPDLNIKAKTIRRHWFERTKIELLFRMIKNDFKIQQITVQNRLGFMKKLSFALVKSVYAQTFTQIVKKTNPKLKRLGFAGIREKLIFHQIGKEWLDEMMKTQTFCKVK